jgi:hypothetical protein
MINEKNTKKKKKKKKKKIEKMHEYGIGGRKAAGCCMCS